MRYSLASRVVENSATAGDCGDARREEPVPINFQMFIWRRFLLLASGRSARAVVGRFGSLNVRVFGVVIRVDDGEDEGGQVCGRWAA